MVAVKRRQNTRYVDLAAFTNSVDNSLGWREQGNQHIHSPILQ